MLANKLNEPVNRGSTDDDDMLDDEMPDNIQQRYGEMNGDDDPLFQERNYFTVKVKFIILTLKKSLYHYIFSRQNPPRLLRQLKGLLERRNQPLQVLTNRESLCGVTSSRVWTLTSGSRPSLERTATGLSSFTAAILTTGI